MAIANQDQLSTAAVSVVGGAINDRFVLVHCSKATGIRKLVARVNGATALAGTVIAKLVAVSPSGVETDLSVDISAKALAAYPTSTALPASYSIAAAQAPANGYVLDSSSGSIDYPYSKDGVCFYLPRDLEYVVPARSTICVKLVTGTTGFTAGALAFELAYFEQ